MTVMPDVPTPALIPDPPVYYAPRAKGSLKPDGRLDKEFWREVPWTEPFSDISGPGFPTPWFQTRAKICWDDENLYIAAKLEGDEIWATIRERDSVIYYDNDFEVFMDPGSSGHNYMELEMNAYNTQWDLMLTHPYRDGGRSVTCWDIRGLETAVYVEGKVNDPSADNRFWSVEIKMPFKSLMETYSNEDNPAGLERCYPCRNAPRVNEFWRFNFSRVQWHVEKTGGGFRKIRDRDGKTLPEENWVWAPTGIIDIHCPEFWGFVFFTEHGEKISVPENEKRKLALRQLYYAQYAWRRAHGRFTAELSELNAPKTDYPIRSEITSRTFLLSCDTADGKGTIYLREDGYTFIEKNM